VLPIEDRGTAASTTSSATPHVGGPLSNLAGLVQEWLVLERLPISHGREGRHEEGRQRARTACGWRTLKSDSPGLTLLDSSGRVGIDFGERAATLGTRQQSITAARSGGPRSTPIAMPTTYGTLREEQPRENARRDTNAWRSDPGAHRSR